MASRCRVLDKILQSTRFGIVILINKVICDHHPQSCARRLHLQSNFWEKRSSIVRQTLNPKASTQCYAEKQLACAAAAAATYLQWCCNWHLESGCKVGKANLGHETEQDTSEVTKLVLETAQGSLCKIRSQRLNKSRTLTLISDKSSSKWTK